MSKYIGNMVALFVLLTCASCNSETILDNNLVDVSKIAAEKVFSKSPDDRVLIIREITEIYEGGLRPAFFLEILDRRNKGHKQSLVLDVEGSDYPWVVTIDWYWNSTVLQCVWGEEKAWSRDVYALRQDVRSGIYFFEEPRVPSIEELIALVRKHTKENPEVFYGVHRLPEESRYDIGSWGRSNAAAGIVCHEHHEGYIELILPFSGAYGWLFLQYKFLFYTPDWVRYDLMQITRYTEKDVPGEPFVKPDAKDVLLYQNPGLPEDLRWKPAYTGPDAYPGSSVDLTKSVDNPQESEDNE